MVGTNELNFLAWLTDRPSLKDALIFRLPDEIFSQDGLQVVAALRGGHTWQHNGVVPPDEEALGFLKTQLLAYLGREIGKSQRSGSLDRIETGYQLLRECWETVEPPPLELYHQIAPKTREFIPTGIQPLDEQILGLSRGELGIIAAAPARGKSCFLINVAVYAAQHGWDAHYITVADAGVDELMARIDAKVLNEPLDPALNLDQLTERHQRAAELLPNRLWISDFTNRECSLTDIERTISECSSDIVIVDHADDVQSPFSSNPDATRHSLRTVYMSLKRLATAYNVPIWTASQTSEQAWFRQSASISDLSEAKVGKSTGCAILLVLTGGPPQHAIPGIVNCTIAKARRFVSQRTLPIRIDYSTGAMW